MSSHILPVPVRSLAALCPRFFPRTLTLSGIVAALLIPVGSGNSGADEGPVEPYVVFVAHDGVYARCGPDGEYYRTDPLRLGQELEVYLQAGDGWLGIRPPENSFSWIPASSVERIGGADSARVIGPRAVAWIGTSLGRARKYRWQVQLAEGEPVVIVGQSERDSGSGPELWYRIVPPSGEFRWVHRTQVVDSAEELVQLNRGTDVRVAQDAPQDRDADALAVDDRDADERAADNRAVDNLAADDRAVEKRAADDRAADRAGDRAADDAVDTAAGPSGPLGGTIQAIAEAFDVDAPAIGSGVAPTAYENAVAGAAPNATIGDQVVLRDIAAAPPGLPPAGAVAADDTSWISGSRPAAATSAGPASAVDPTAPVQASASGTGQASAAAEPAATLTPTAPPVLQQISRDDAAATAALAGRIASADVDQLQLELSRQMAAAAPASMLEPIRQRTSEWVQRLSDPVQLGRARVLLERVEQYQRVARRRSGQPAALPLTARATALPGTDATALSGAAEKAPAAADDAGAADAGAADAGAAENASAAVDGPPAFDRTGYLVQVYSARPDAPPFALTDGSGRTLAYVSPTPGLNLRRYLNTHIGLNGQLSFHTGLETPHLIAQRAVQISR